MFLKPIALLFITVVLLNAEPGLMAPSEAKSNDYYCSVVDSDIGHTRNAVMDGKVWPSTSLTYTIDPSFSEEEVTTVDEALKTINECSCLEFVKFPQLGLYDQPNVRYVPSDSSSSIVGYSNKTPHLIYLSKDHRSDTETILHETFHMLGLFHEHTRHDRDNYVVIEEENVDRWEINKGNFESRRDTRSLNVGYNYNSIMHYPKNAFSRNGATTIYALENGVKVERDFGSKKPALSDWKKISRLYNCNRPEEQIPEKCY
nr:astacin-like metalloprotease toxin 5 [Drosophila bipectinata]